MSLSNNRIYQNKDKALNHVKKTERGELINKFKQISVQHKIFENLDSNT